MFVKAAEGFTDSAQGANITFETTPTVSTSGSRTERMRITSAGNVGIGTTAPGAILDLYGTGTLRSAMIVPRDSTANRPSSPVNGMIRYASDTNQLEGYINGSWQTIGTSGGSGSLAGSSESLSGGLTVGGGESLTGGLNGKRWP